MNLLSVLITQFLSEEGGKLIQGGNLPVIGSLNENDKNLRFKPSSQVGQKEAETIAVGAILS